MSGDRESRDASHFQRLYDASPDPWKFRTSAYEQSKYQTTIASLGTRRFRSGFEAGCSIGVLTRLLAERCDRLLAVDIIGAPLSDARKACADQLWVRFEQKQVPDESPDECFDLIVLSEVLSIPVTNGHRQGGRSCLRHARRERRRAVGKLARSFALALREATYQPEPGRSLHRRRGGWDFH